MCCSVSLVSDIHDLRFSDFIIFQIFQILLSGLVSSLLWTTTWVNARFQTHVISFEKLDLCLKLCPSCFVTPVGNRRLYIQQLFEALLKKSFSTSSDNDVSNKGIFKYQKCLGSSRSDKLVVIRLIDTKSKLLIKYSIYFLMNYICF